MHLFKPMILSESFCQMISFLSMDMVECTIMSNECSEFKVDVLPWFACELCSDFFMVFSPLIEYKFFYH